MNAQQMMQEQILYGLLQKLENKHLTKDMICRAILTGDQKQIRRFERLEAVGHAMITALRFHDYRRAARYLLVFEKLCRSNKCSVSFSKEASIKLTLS